MLSPLASAGVELHHHGNQVVKVPFQPIRGAETLPRVHFGFYILRLDGNESHLVIYFYTSFIQCCCFIVYSSFVSRMIFTF